MLLWAMYGTGVFWMCIYDDMHRSGSTVLDGRVDWGSWMPWGLIPQLDKFYPIQHGIVLP